MQPPKFTFKEGKISGVVGLEANGYIWNGHFLPGTYDEVYSSIQFAFQGNYEETYNQSLALAQFINTTPYAGNPAAFLGGSSTNCNLFTPYDYPDPNNAHRVPGLAAVNSAPDHHQKDSLFSVETRFFIENNNENYATSYIQWKRIRTLAPPSNLHIE